VRHHRKARGVRPFVQTAVNLTDALPGRCCSACIARQGLPRQRVIKLVVPSVCNTCIDNINHAVLLYSLLDALALDWVARCGQSERRTLSRYALMRRCCLGARGEQCRVYSLPPPHAPTAPSSQVQQSAAWRGLLRSRGTVQQRGLWSASACEASASRSLRWSAAQRLL